jgi:hypothetical protein
MIISSALAFAVGVAFGPTRARAEKAPKKAADLSGRWILNKELTDDAREKMREAAEGRRGGGPGGGPPPMEPGGGGEPAEELAITQTEPEIVIDEKFGRVRTLHPNGKSYKTENGAADLKTEWKDGRLLAETKNTRGGKLIETWELIPDRSRLIVNVRFEGGFGPAVSLKRVYDRAPATK